MSYVLEAFIGLPAALADLTRGRADVAVVKLQHGLALIPFTAAARQALHVELDDAAEAYAPFACLSREAGLLAQARAGEAGLAYVEAEFFGGAGAQVAILWRNGRVALGPVGDVDAINQVLHELGVVRDGERDAFDSIGLGRHRDTSRW